MAASRRGTGIAARHSAAVAVAWPSAQISAPSTCWRTRPGLTTRPQSTAHTRLWTCIRWSALIVASATRAMCDPNALAPAIPRLLPGPPPSHPARRAAAWKQRASRPFSPSSAMRRPSGSSPAARASSSMKLSPRTPFRARARRACSRSGKVRGPRSREPAGSGRHKARRTNEPALCTSSARRSRRVRQATPPSRRRSPTSIRSAAVIPPAPGSAVIRTSAPARPDRAFARGRGKVTCTGRPSPRPRCSAIGSAGLAKLRPAGSPGGIG